MAAIIPDSTAQFFGDVGLSPEYDDSRYFASDTAKDTFFDTVAHESVLSCTYIRGQENKIRVQLPMSLMYNKQYMRYKNTSFVGKWFYAFITRVEYINNVTTEVTFENDPVMTWMGSFTLGRCFVERQHSATDEIGDNIIEENLDIGDYVYHGITRTHLFDSYYIIIGASVDQNGDNVAGGTMINNVYSGIVLHSFGTASGANGFIDLLTDKAKSDALVGAVMCPQGIMVDRENWLNFEVFKNISSLDGYTPKNNKLFTFPFNYLVVTNGDGNFATLRYEFFEDYSVCSFNINGMATLQPEVVLEPAGYKFRGAEYNAPYNTAEKMVLKNFPQCGFNIDQYKAFLAQNSSSIAADAISTVGSGIVATVGNAMAGNLVGAASSAFSTGMQILDRVAMHKDYAKKPTQANGATTYAFEAGKHIKDFYFLQQTITQEYARAIDSFFDAFGYAQKKIMQPDMHARPGWTYIKTIGAIVHCSAPAEDVRKIEECLNRGIRFWDSSVTIGDYSQSNAAPAQLRIVQQPQSVEVEENESVTFTIVTRGDGVTYQWQSKGAQEPDFTSITGATSSSYTGTALASWDGAEFRCLVTDSRQNTLTSSVATVTIETPNP